MSAGEKVPEINKHFETARQYIPMAVFGAILSTAATANVISNLPHQDSLGLAIGVTCSVIGAAYSSRMFSKAYREHARGLTEEAGKTREAVLQLRPS